MQELVCDKTFPIIASLCHSQISGLLHFVDFVVWFSFFFLPSLTSLLFGSHTMLSFSILKINIGWCETKLSRLLRAVFSAASPFLSKYLPVSLFPFLSCMSLAWWWGNSKREHNKPYQNSHWIHWDKEFIKHQRANDVQRREITARTKTMHGVRWVGWGGVGGGGG